MIVAHTFHPGSRIQAQTPASIFTPAIASLSIFSMLFVVHMQKHVRGISWIGGTGLSVLFFFSLQS
jgi:hypothetical protein